MMDFQVGSRVRHPELGEGVIIASAANGFLTVYFREHGERQVRPDDLGVRRDAWDELAQRMRPATAEALRACRLGVEAASLPFMENAAALTSAKIDLLPHQIVLVHRIANADPRRFLIADEVGLGKTIETALILRELASRGELTRAQVDDCFRAWIAHAEHGNSFKLIQRMNKFYKSLWEEDYVSDQAETVSH